MNFLSKIILLFAVTCSSVLSSPTVFVYNNTYKYFNRYIFVRNYDQIYVCLLPGGWNQAADSLAAYRKNISTYFFDQNTITGIFQLRCGSDTIVIEIIDSGMLDIIIDPPFPKSLSRGDQYMFRVLFQPYGVNLDKSYIWHPYQIGNGTELHLERITFLLYITIEKNVSLGSYGLGIHLDCITKEYIFNVTKEVIRIPIRFEVYGKADSSDSLRGVNRYFIEFLVIGTVIVILGIFVYVCAISCTERNRFADITGHKNLIIEEECLLDDNAKKCFKIMNNPMSREKDVELILQKAKELQSSYNSLSPLGGCRSPSGGSNRDMGGIGLEKNPYGITPETIRFLRAKFSKGVCLNCVKLASQLILLNKEDCPSIHHICQDENCLNHGKPLRCLCAEMQINETARPTYELYNATTSARQCCQVTNSNTNNSNSSNDTLATKIKDREDQTNLSVKQNDLVRGVNDIEFECNNDELGDLELQWIDYVLQSYDMCNSWQLYRDKMFYILHDKICNMEHNGSYKKNK